MSEGINEVVATLVVLLVAAFLAGTLVALLQLVRHQRRAALTTAKWVAGAATLALLNRRGFCPKVRVSEV